MLWFLMTFLGMSLCESVAILVTTFNLFTPFLLRFPCPLSPATPETGKLCFRALVSKDDTHIIMCESFGPTGEAGTDNGSGLPLSTPR